MATPESFHPMPNKKQDEIKLTPRKTKYPFVYMEVGQVEFVEGAGDQIRGALSTLRANRSWYFSCRKATCGAKEGFRVERLS